MAHLDQTDAALAASVYDALDQVEQALIGTQAGRHGRTVNEEIIAIMCTTLERLADEFYAELEE
jgi:hypothetical protein